MCLLHNIRPSKPVLAKLREQKDPRALKFQNHLNTLLGRVPIEPLLKRADPGPSERPTEKAKIVLKDFIVWVKSKRPFTGLIPPPAFFAPLGMDCRLESDHGGVRRGTAAGRAHPARAGRTLHHRRGALSLRLVCRVFLLYAATFQTLFK